MTQNLQANVEKKIAQAPVSETSLIASQVVSVEVAEDEKVAWHWTHDPSGKSVVTGYSIVQKKAEPSTGGFDYEKAIAARLRQSSHQSAA